MAAQQSDDDGWWIFGRSVSSLPAGGTVTGDVRRSVLYLQTMTVRTAIAGSVLLIASFLVIPAALLVGYVAAAARSAAFEEPLPGFDDWGLIVRGIGLMAVFTLLLFGPMVFAGVVAVALGQSTAGDAVGGLTLLGWFYVTPWGLAVFGAEGWRGLLDGVAWRWLGTGHYLLTVLVSAALSILLYFAILVSVFTLVGWLLVGFCAPVVLAVFGGQRYREFAGASQATTGSTVGSSEVAAAVSGVASSFGETVAGAVGDISDAAPARAETAQSGDDADTDSAGASGAVAESAVTEPSAYAEQLAAATVTDSEGALERYEAEDGVRFVALAADHDDPAARRGFERALDRWGGITHNPRVATVLESDDEPRPWVAYDSLDGPLSAFRGDLSGAETVVLVANVEEAIRTGRRYNVAHGEVRPACVCVERAGGTAPASERLDATLAEWGVGGEVAAKTGVDGRSVRYLAPEQFAGDGADARVDVYQLAAVAHFAQLGEPPFAAVETERLTAADRDVSWSQPDGVYLSQELVAVFERALATDPDERYDSTAAFLRAFRGSIE